MNRLLDRPVMYEFGGMLIQFGIVVVVMLYSAPTGLEVWEKSLIGAVFYAPGMMLVMVGEHRKPDGVPHLVFPALFVFACISLFAAYFTPVVITDASWRLVAALFLSAAAIVVGWRVGKLGIPDVKHGDGRRFCGIKQRL